MKGPALLIGDPVPCRHCNEGARPPLIRSEPGSEPSVLSVRGARPRTKCLIRKGRPARTKTTKGPAQSLKRARPLEWNEGGPAPNILWLEV